MLMRVPKRAAAQYSLSGSGLLSASSENIGISGTGTFTQCGGTNSVSGRLLLSLNDAYGPGLGTYSLSGSGLLSAVGETLAQCETGTFTQSGGTNSAGSLVLTQSSNCFAAYNLNGGLLVLSALSRGSGSAAFNFGGGTLGQRPWSSSLAMNLTGSGGNSTVDTTGGNISLSGNLTGMGGLTKIGSGTLTLAISNGYTGTTLVSNGTLLLGNADALVGSTFDTSGSGSLSFGTLTSAAFGGLQGSGGLVLSNASSVDVSLSVGGNNANITFSGNLSDLNSGGSLTKTGTGTLLLSGDDSYGGGTTVLDGTLELLDASALPAGTSLTVSPGGTLIFDPSGGGAPLAGDVRAVPEPATFALLAAGTLGLLGYGWRRRRAARIAKPVAFDQPDDPPILSFPSDSSPASAARRAA